MSQQQNDSLWRAKIIGPTTRGPRIGSSSLDILFNSVRLKPQLTQDQEITLARQIERARSRNHELEERRAKEELILSNLALVYRVARRYLGHGMPIEDLIQEGIIGLMRAVESFDYRKGYRLSSYAICLIKRSICRAIAEQARMIRLPVHVTEQLSQVQQTRHTLSKELGRLPTEAELAAELNLTENKLTQLQQQTVEPLSLEIPVGKDGQNRLADLIPSPDTASPLAEVMRHELPAEVHAALNLLTRREQEVILLRNGLDRCEPCSLEEVGAMLHITRERVRRIEATAMKKLREHIAQQTQAENGSPEVMA